MLHEIGVELQAALRAQGCPFSVYDRESTTTATYARERIVIEHAGNDGFGPVRSARANPKHRMTRSIAAKLTIYAQSPKSGAKEFEHERRAEHVLDMVLVAMGNVAGARKNAWTPTGGKFITPEEFAATQAYAGAAYELAFTFDRAVIDVTWAGAADEELTIEEGLIVNTTMVSLANGPDDDDDPTTVPATAEAATGEDA